MRRIALIALFGLASTSAIAQQDPPTPPGQAPAPPGPTVRVFVGTYTKGTGSKGIYRCDFDVARGVLTPKGVAAESINPSWLAIHPSFKYLYAVNEVGDFGGKRAGSVEAFAIDPKAGALTALNKQTSGGADPCHLSIDPTGKFALVANYSGGSVAVLPIGDDGTLGPPSDLSQHKGSSVDKGRQQGPHAHAANLDPSGRLVIVPDLGLDKLMLYRLDTATGKLGSHTPAWAEVAPGSGPRHFAFHPDGRHAYAINEMGSTITTFDFEPAREVFTTMQTTSTRPKNATRPGNSTAEIVVHPSGRLVIGSNRGDDTLASFAVDPASGQLTPIASTATGGKTPRSFAIDPTGQFVLAANQDSGTIAVFAINPANGQLQAVGEPAKVPAPVCIVFAPIGDQ